MRVNFTEILVFGQRVGRKICGIALEAEEHSRKTYPVVKLGQGAVILAVYEKEQGRWMARKKGKQETRRHCSRVDGTDHTKSSKLCKIYRDCYNK